MNKFILESPARIDYKTMTLTIDIGTDKKRKFSFDEIQKYTMLFNYAKDVLDNEVKKINNEK
jgi:hypothetical protein